MQIMLMLVTLIRSEQNVDELKSVANVLSNDQTQFCSCVWDITSSVSRVRCVYLLLPGELFSWGGEGEAEVKRMALHFQDWRATGTMSRVPWWLGCTMEKVSWCTSVTTVRRRTRRRLARPSWWTRSPLLTPPWPRWLARGFSPKTGVFQKSIVGDLY